MTREPIPTWFFVLVVVRRGNRFLLVHEKKHGQLWYLPAGRVEPGEDLMSAAVRETLEETDIPIEVEGTVRVEHTPFPDGTTRLRVIFVARPKDDPPPKSNGDEESLEAGWFTLEEIAYLPLRGDDVLQIFQHVADGGLVVPLSFIDKEGSPFR